VRSHFSLLMWLGLLLILAPLVNSLMHRSDLPAPVGHIGVGKLLSALDANWQFIDETSDTVFAALGLAAPLVVYRCRQSGADVASDEVDTAIVVASPLTSAVAPPVVRRQLLRAAPAWSG
jgi:hypothetical protein